MIVSLISAVPPLLLFAAFPGPLAFVTGGYAFAPTVGALHPSGADTGGLKGPATTAYAAVLPPGGGTATYFAQPDDGPLFAPTTGSFMAFHELPGTALPGGPIISPPVTVRSSVPVSRSICPHNS